MDNLTHTLVGVLIGEGASRIAPANADGLDRTRRRSLFVTIMALGSNLPDLDFVPSRITGSKLDYLLHHRGHTHTILGALAIAALLYVAVEAWLRWRKESLTRADRLHLMGIASLATLLHIALDFTNSYGVHPFWPFDNRWYYGDALFIVEPFFWAACAPLAFVLRTRLAKSLVFIAVATGIFLSFSTGMVPTFMAVALASFALVMLAIGKFMRPGIAVGFAVAAWLAINAWFAQSSAVARREVETIAHAMFPEDRLLDVVLTPMPVNPFCWQVLVVQSSAQHLHVRRASLSLAPTLIASRACPTRAASATTTATYVAFESTSTEQISWGGEVATELASILEWISRDCVASSFMRFARAPWLIETESGTVIGDARFDHERALSFAEIVLDGSERCAKQLAPWEFPRPEMNSGP